jgi:DNA modification methylase
MLSELFASGVSRWRNWESPCGRVLLVNGDCLEVLPYLFGVTAVVTDPPYGLSFMGKDWDHGVPEVSFWKAVLSACSPGAHLLAFGGTRTHHRLACAIEDAEWEIRDCLMWLYGQGFPKSLDVSKAIDKSAGVEREVIGTKRLIDGSLARKTARFTNNQENISGFKDSGNLETAPATDSAIEWNGYGTALKPAWEPIIVARKFLDGTVANNCLTHGCGALNIDGCRVGVSVNDDYGRSAANSAGVTIKHSADVYGKYEDIEYDYASPKGRFPANVIHDGSDEVVKRFPNAPGQQGNLEHQDHPVPKGNAFGQYGPKLKHIARNDSGSASRFFYCAKASRSDRGEGNNHPTVKPTSLMEYLVRLIKQPTKNVFCDPFMGSATTLVACIREGVSCIGIEQDSSYFDIAVDRCKRELGLVRDKPKNGQSFLEIPD